MVAERESPIFRRALGLFARGRMDLTLVDGRGRVRAISPNGIRNSHWPVQIVMREGIPAPTRHLYVAPAEEAMTTGRPVLLPDVRYSTRNRNLRLRIRHIPVRLGSGERLSISHTSTLAGAPDEHLWAPEAEEDRTALWDFADLLQTQVTLWSESSAFLVGRDAGEAGAIRAARVHADAQSRIEEILRAAFAAWSPTRAPRPSLPLSF